MRVLFGGQESVCGLHRVGVPGYARRISAAEYAYQAAQTPSHVAALVASPSFRVGHAPRPARDTTSLALAAGVSAIILSSALDVWCRRADSVPAAVLGKAEEVVEGVVKHRLMAPASVALFYVSNYVGLALFSHYLVPLTIVVAQVVFLLSFALLPALAASLLGTSLLWIPAVALALFIISYYSSVVLACKLFSLGCRSLLHNWPLLVVVPVLHIAFESTYVPFALGMGLWSFRHPSLVLAVMLHCLWAYESLRCFISVVTSGTVALWITRPSYTSPVDRVAEALERASRSSLGTVAICGAILNALKVLGTLAGRCQRYRWLYKAVELLNSFVSRYVDYMLVYVGAYGMGFWEAFSRSKNLVEENAELLALQELVHSSWVKAGQRIVISVTSLVIMAIILSVSSLGESLGMTIGYYAISVHMVMWCVLGRAIDTVTVMQVEQCRYVSQYPANVGGEAAVLREISQYAREAQETRRNMAPVLATAWKALGLFAVLHVVSLTVRGVPGYARRITAAEYAYQAAQTPSHVAALVASPSFRVGHAPRTARDTVSLALAAAVSAFVLGAALDFWSRGAPSVPASVLGKAEEVVEGIVEHRLMAPASVALFYVSNYVGLALFSHYLVPLTIAVAQVVSFLSFALLLALTATYLWSSLLWVPAVALALFAISYYSSLVLACKLFSLGCRSLLHNWPLLLVVPALHIAFEVVYVPLVLEMGLWSFRYPGAVLPVALHGLWAFESLRCFVSVITSSTVALWITRPSYTSPVRHLADSLERVTRSSLGTVAICGALLNSLKVLSALVGRFQRARWLRKALGPLSRAVSRYVDYMLVFVGVYGMGFCDAFSQTKNLLAGYSELMALQKFVHSSWVKAAQRAVFSVTVMVSFFSLDESFGTMVYAAISVHMVMWCMLGRAVDTVTVMQVEQYRYICQYPANTGGEAAVLREISLSSGRMADDAGSRDLKPLQGLRGVCSVVIVVGHFYGFFSPRLLPLAPGQPWTAPSGSLVPLDYLQAVTLFFLLSGIGLSRFYSRSGALDTARGRWAFAAKRLARLGPAYYVSLALGLAPFLLVTRQKLLLVSALSFVITGNEWVGPLWQVSAFVLCYLVYLCVHRRLRVASAPALWVLAALCYLAPACATTALVVYVPIISGLAHLFFPVRLPHFLLGAVLGEAIERALEDRRMLSRQCTNGEPLLGDRAVGSEGDVVPAYGCSDGIVDALSVVLALTQGASFGVNYAAPGLWSTYTLLCEMWVCAVHAVWLFYMVRGPASLTTRLLCTAPLQWLGGVSYALYCLHWPLLRLYVWAYTRSLLDRQNIWFALEPWHIAIVLPVLVALSFLFDRFVSEPIRKAVGRACK
eukprot:m51a1_g411 hypothetical protein (1348) ;mRNA; f:753249-761576